MRIWLVKSHEPLPNNSFGDRLFRTGIFYKILNSMNHEVIWWTSSFDHFRKKNNFNKDVDLFYGKSKIKVIKTPGYSNNISVTRLFDHLINGLKFFRKSLNEKKPDIIICSLPIFSTSLATYFYSKIFNVKYIIDYRDNWPEAIYEDKKGISKLILKLFTFPHDFMIKIILKNSYGITSITEKFLHLALDKSNRKKNEKDLFINIPYIPHQKKIIESNIKKEIIHFLRSKNCIYIVFVGSISHMIGNLENVYRSALNIYSHDKKFKFIFCGDGDKKNIYEKKYKSKNILNTGFVNHETITYVMKNSHIGILPYSNTEMWYNTIPNKFIEYLSEGLYLLTSLKRGLIYDLIKKNNLGSSYSKEKEKNLINILPKIDFVKIEKERFLRRSFFVKNYSKKITEKKLKSLLEKI